MQAASSSGDISALLNLIVSSSALKPEDFIKQTVGSVLFVYYVYMDTFKQKPSDLDDLIDGLLYIDSKNYMQEQAIKEAKRSSK